ncbi:MAG: Cna B-type domain-containing protein [Angelakisella sp.]|mgnify:FL=1|uniref:SpaA isopeptide-forming pilin-related protein n=1 Tax=Angelakisella sp. TaxID=1935177 RepID=UPI003FF010AB|nr:Cna B-type domain-containing protein [Angelakisella sp.]
MHTKISSGKEHRRHRARRVSVLLVVLALLFTMLPTGLYTVADAAPAEEEPALVPAPEEALPEPEDSMTKEEETDEQPAEAQPAEDKARAAAATVECYAARDGIWYPVTTVQTAAQYADGSGKLRYYITAAELEEVYGAYGFKAANYHGERFFPHTDSYDPNKMWAGAAPIKSEDGGWQIPLSHRTEIRLYYLPANKEGAESYFLDKKELSNETLLAENMFYTVTVEDDLNRVYQEPPAPKIAFHGENVSITLNTVSSMAWDAMDGLTGTHLELEPTKQTETSVTYTIEKISQPVVFYPHTDTLVIKYEAEPDGWQHKIGQFEPSVQAPQQSAMVKGKKTLLVEPGDGDYTLLAPDIDRIEVKLTGEKANNRSLFYSFLGWRVANITEEVLLQPGTKLTAADLQHYTGSDGEVTLRAKWSGEDKLKRPITTHFFLHLNGEIRGSVDDGVQWEDQKDYTPALYTIRMLGADNIPAEYSNKNAEGVVKPLVARATNGDNAYAVDDTIRNMVNNPVQGGRLEDLPNEETIFAYLRAHSDTITMKVDGVEIPAEMLNSDYFQIRWNMVKFEHSDGWHIDGVLVAKRTRFFVTKTFAGDAEAIKQVRDKFLITVSHTENGSSVTDFTLVPQPAKAVTEQGKLGYTRYDAEADTYTWEVPAQQRRDYTIKETGHTLQGDKWRVNNRYLIRNHPQGLSGGYQDYPEESGITITAVAYGNDVPNTAVQTVALQNIYVGIGTLTVKTQDSITGNGLAKVEYKLSRPGGAEVVLYRKPNTTLYSVVQEEGYTEQIADCKIIADASGFFTIRLEEGTYTLTETLPTGYFGPGTVQVTVVQNTGGNISYHAEAKALPEGITPSTGSWLQNADADNVVILNVPRMLISVTARSSWPATGDKLPVTVELWRDGAPLPGDAYTVELNKENEWQYTWENLPLFTDGTVADYTLREIEIGDTYRDPGVAEDGFADYLVTYAKALYRQAEDKEYREEHWWQKADGTQCFAREALLVVNNEGIRGEIAFEKVDEKGYPLKGAEFTLYADAECTKRLATATSDENGDVQFEDKWPAGTYYLRETTAPVGYTAAELTWTVKIAAGKATISTPGGTTVTEVKNTSRLRLKLKVLGPLGEELPGAVLRVTRDNGSPMLYKTNEAGAALLEQMPAGDYIIQLAGTPTGYVPEDSAPNLKAEYGTLTYLDTANTAWQLEQCEGEEYTYLLTLKLKELHILPSTGGTGTVPFTLAGAALMAVAVLLPGRKKVK